VKLTSQFWTAPNQLTLLRLLFVPFILMSVLDGHWGWALTLFIAAGVSDGLDGLLARALHQKTTLGEYLDPIADKLLLSSLFLTMSFVHQIPWRYTILVFSRDLSLLVVSAVVYNTTSVRDFSPSIFGKVNTFFQLTAVFFVMVGRVHPDFWIRLCRSVSLYATFAFTLISGVHYILLMGRRLHAANHKDAESAS